MACNQRYTTNVENSITQKYKTNNIFYNSINQKYLSLNILS